VPTPENEARGVKLTDEHRMARILHFFFRASGRVTEKIFLSEIVGPISTDDEHVPWNLTAAGQVNLPVSGYF
jgi:hypothetical protein